MTATAPAKSAGTPWRSVSSSMRAQQSPVDRADAPEEPVETLFRHDKVNVYSFLYSKIGSSHSASGSPQTAGTLRWQSPNEAILGLDSPLRLERTRNGASFLIAGKQSSEVRLPMMPNTLMWCVDAKSIFATNSRQSTYRIKLPYSTDEDRNKVDEFKKAISKVIQYEPDDVPCPFRRQSEDEQRPDDIGSPKRQTPKRALLGAFEEIKRTTSDGAPRTVESEEIDRPPVQRTASSLAASDEDEAGATFSSIGLRAGEGSSEETTPSMRPREPESAGSIGAPSSETLSSVGQLSPVTRTAKDGGEHKAALPVGAENTCRSSDHTALVFSPQAHDSPLEPSSPLLLDGEMPESLIVHKQRPSDVQTLVDTTTVNTPQTAPTAESFQPVASTNNPDASSDSSAGEVESSASVSSTSEAEIRLPDPAAESLTSAGAAADPNPEQATQSTTHMETQKIPTPEVPFKSTVTEIPVLPPHSNRYPVELASGLHLRTSTANKAIASTSTSPVEATGSSPRSSTETIRRPPPSDPNTYILTKLIDLLTSPPSKIFGLLIDLLHLLYDRAFGGTASVGGGVDGRLRLPQTPGRWVESEEDSEDEEDADDANGAERDDSDDDSNVDDYGVPLGNDASMRATRAKMPNGLNRDGAAATGVEVD